MRATMIDGQRPTRRQAGTVSRSELRRTHARNAVRSPDAFPDDDMTPKKPTAFGQYIVDAMTSRVPRMERVELAGLVGVSPSTISRWIMSPIRPDTTLLRKLAKALDLDYSEVLDRAGHGATTARPASLEMDRQALELNDMYSPTYGLSVGERERLRISVDTAMQGFRKSTRRRRTG